MVTFTPPRAHGTPAGDVAFGVRVFSREDPAGSTVEEGVITIAPFSEIGSEIVPRTCARPARKARYEVAVDNRGNVPVTTELLGTDPDQLIRFEINPSMITCEPGTATFARVVTKPKGELLARTAEDDSVPGHCGSAGRAAGHRRRRDGARGDAPPVACPRCSRRWPSPRSC